MSVVGASGTTPIPSPPSTSSALSYGPFASEPALAEVMDGSRTIAFGDSGSHVKALEDALVKVLGRLPWNARPNTRVEAATREAVEDFQSANGLPATGVVDRDTLAALDRALAGSPGAPAAAAGSLAAGSPFAGDPTFAAVLAGRRTIAFGDRGDHVKVLEEALVKLTGELPWNAQPNETATAATRKAIIEFQSANGLSPTGAVDSATLLAMDRALAATRPGATTPTAPTAPSGPQPTDFASKAVLERYGLNTSGMTTESTYEGQEWGSTGYFPYFGEVQYTAFAKHAAVFGAEGAADAHSYFELYSNPPGGLDAGSWVANGTVRESDFESSAGVDVTGDRVLDNAAYKLLRESGAPQLASFALRKADGAPIEIKQGDRLVPTVLKDGKPAEVSIDGDSNYADPASGDSVGRYDVVWRVKREGAVLADTTLKTESRTELLGVKSDVKFDFLDASGEMVGFNPPADRMAETWEQDGKWHVLAKKGDGFEHQVLDGDRVTSTETVDAAKADELKSGQSVINRVQTVATGRLKGDGKVGGSFDMSWWGKCHNVASLSTTNMPRPERAVNVITNLEPGETAAVRWPSRGDDANVLVPKAGPDGAITGYEHQVRDGDGSIKTKNALSLEEGKRLAEGKDHAAVIVRADGSLKSADVTSFDTRSLTALVAHVGDGGVEYVGGAGERYYAHPDILVLEDGRQIQAHIKEVKTDSGKTHPIGYRSGTEFKESDRSELRAPGMDTRVLSSGSRRMNFNVQDMTSLQRYRDDNIKELTVIHPDGREETIKASDVELFAWENRFDFSPDKVWDLHKTITKERSTVIETYDGTQVWNYSARGMTTNVLDPKDLSASEREAAKKPGMMAGTVGDEGKVYFRTQIDTDGSDEDMTYWVKFDAEGNIEDYSYLGNNVPDFVWTQHVKTDKEWSGESQAPGVKNRDIQRLYHASMGRLDSHTLPGGFITTAALSDAPAAPQ